MLSKLFRCKTPPEEYVPEVLKNLTVAQQKHYEKFRELLKEFYLGKDFQNPTNGVLYIGISDGLFGSISVGEIASDGSFHLSYPKPQSLYYNGFREVLSGVLRLKETLENGGIPYKENMIREEYTQQVRGLSEANLYDLISDLEAKIRSSAH